MGKFRYLFAAGIIVLDQVVKACVRGSMYLGQSIPVFRNIFHITYVQNRGAAFSLLTGHGILLVLIPLVAIFAGIWYMEKNREEHWTMHMALILIIAGGVGNLIDRICLGFVTDMLDFRFWPVFNVADIAVCVGAGFLILYTLFFSGLKIKEKS